MENQVNCSAELETRFSLLSMNLNINRSAFRICPPLNLVFKIRHLLGGQILKSSLPIITREAGQVISKSTRPLGQLVLWCILPCLVSNMHQSFVFTVPLPMGMGGDNDFSLYSMRL